MFTFIQNFYFLETRRSRLIGRLSNNFPSVDHNNYNRVAGHPLQTHHGLGRENFGRPSNASHYNYGSNSGYYGHPAYSGFLDHDFYSRYGHSNQYNGKE